MKTTSVLFILLILCSNNSNAQKMIRTEDSLIIRKNAKIPTGKNGSPVFKPAITTPDKPLELINTKTGYLVFYKKPALGKVTFYNFSDSSYQFYGELMIDSVKANDKIILDEGIYKIKLESKGTVREFRIINNMITDLAL